MFLEKQPQRPTRYIQLPLFHTLDPRWSNWWGGGGRSPWRCQPWLSAAAALDSLPVAAKHTIEHSCREGKLELTVGWLAPEFSLRKHPSDSPFLLGEDLEQKPSWKQYTAKQRDIYSSSYADSKCKLRAFLVAQMVKNLPAMQETWVQSLDLEDLLEKEMATHSSSLAWKIPWTKEPGRVTVHGVTKSWTWLSLTHTHTHTHTHTLKYCCCCRSSTDHFYPAPTFWLVPIKTFFFFGN